MEQAQSYLRNISLAYLNFPELDQLVQTTGITEPAPNLGPIAQLGHLAISNSPSAYRYADLLRHLLPNPTPRALELSNSAVTSLLNDTVRTRRNSNFQNTQYCFHLLPYFCSYWLYHCANLNPSGTTEWAAFRRIFHRGGLPIEHRPWASPCSTRENKEIATSQDFFIVSALAWAIKSTHSAIAYMCLREYGRRDRTENMHELDMRSIFETVIPPVGLFPLHYAALLGNDISVNLLLKEGADANSRAVGGMTVLYTASTQAEMKFEIIKSLIAAGADLEALNPLAEESLEPSYTEETALAAACRTSNLQKVQLLLSVGADCFTIVGETSRSYLSTPLQVACQVGNLDIVKCLIQKHLPALKEIIGKPEPSTISVDAYNLLHGSKPIQIRGHPGLSRSTTIGIAHVTLIYKAILSAVLNGHHKIIKYFISNDLNLNLDLDCDFTIADNTKYNARESITISLEEAGNFGDFQVTSCLEATVKFGRLKIVNLLTQSGYSYLWPTSRSLEKALRASALAGHLEAVEALCEFWVTRNRNHMYQGFSAIGTLDGVLPDIRDQKVLKKISNIIDSCRFREIIANNKRSMRLNHIRDSLELYDTRDWGNSRAMET